MFPKYDDYYMEKVIFDDLILDDQFEEDREVSEFARSELKFEYSMTYEKQTEAGSTI